MITTTIYGLTGVGNTEYTGLAMSRNDVVITASSSNYALPNFKYIFKVGNSATGQELKFYQEQNFNNCASFNLKGIMMNVIQETIQNSSFPVDVVTTPQEFLTDNIFTNRIRVEVFAGWDVAGVFTEDTVDMNQYDLMILDGEGDDCYIPLGTFSNPTAGALVEKNENRTGFNRGTYNQDLKDVRLTLRESSNITWFLVPRRRRWNGDPVYHDWEFHYSSHYRSLVFIADDGTFLNNDYPYRQIGSFVIRFYSYSGVPLGDCNIPFTLGAGTLFVLPTGLQNLDEAGYLATAGITDSTLVKFWVVSFLDLAGTSSIFFPYGYYMEDECCYNEISLTWLNRFGGFESMGFVKKNERTLSTEKKRVMNIEGNYADATPETFNIPYTSRTIKEKEPIKTHTMTLNTGWINEEEFRRLKYLISSRSVWMEDSNYDGGKLLPVLVETSNFTSRRERNTKKYNATIDVRMAYSKRNLNLFNTRTEGEIGPMNIGPAPDPCLQLNGFAIAHSGNSGLVPTYNVAPIPIVCTEVAQHHHVEVRIEFNDGSQMEAGENYCVMLTWDSLMDTDIPTSADLGKVSVGNGPSAIDIYWDGANPMLSTGWNTCYNSLGGAWVRIEFPTFVSNKYVWDGVLTLHIKKINPECPCGGY